MILRVQGLEFAYDDHPVLKGVDLHVGAGEILAILGPNGVGKTTLLKCMNGIRRPRGGSVLVDGADVLRMSPGRVARSTSYVAQRSETARLTVFDAVLMGRRPHIRWAVSDKDLQMVDATLRRLRLDHLLLRYIDTLSGGELQQVCVARALVQEPRLLLLDEPTSSLDLLNQVSLLSLIRRIVTEHRIAAVMSMHDLNTALRFAHKYVFLKDGRVAGAGVSSDVTAGLVEEVYGLPVEIHQVQGNPVVVPLQAPSGDPPSGVVK